MALDTVHLGSANYQNKVETDRRLLARLMRMRTGVITGFALSQPAGMNMGIAAGEAVVPGTSAPTTQGSYFVTDMAAAVVAWPAAAASPRIDALVLAVGDTQYGALGASMGGTIGPKWVVVQGTPNASPVAPTDATIQTAIGAGAWIRVADVLIPVGSSTISPANVTLKWVNVGAYLPYTPTLVAVAGNFTNTRYTIGPDNHVHAWGMLSLSGPPSSAFALGLPLPAFTSQTITAIGTWVALDVGTSRYTGVCMLRDATSFFPWTTSGASALGPSNPFVWAAGDLISWEINYEAA